MADENRWRPPSVGDGKLDFILKNLYDQMYGMDEVSLQSPLGRKQRLAAGALQVTGNVKDVATGLAAVLFAVVAFESSAALNEWVTWEPAAGGGGRINLYCWKPTAAGDNTPVASTTPRRVHWFAWGMS